MTLAEKQRELIEDFSIIEDPVERFSAIVDRGRRAPALPDEARTDAHLVPGCTSRVWLTGWAENGGDSCQFRVEADAPSVQGVAALLCELYSGATPAEVIAIEPECLTALGIHRQLTLTRMRGLSQVRRRIREIAESLAND
ncbi:MAG: SufE family protein [Verrucomicrobiae bacterium]|nr:SufE family protein [Verrucomicrobiae bacterium]